MLAPPCTGKNLPICRKEKSSAMAFSTLSSMVPAIALVLALAVLWGSSIAEALSSPPRKVLVTGASGRTGKIVFSLLKENPSYSTVGLVRSEASAKQLMKNVDCDLDQLFVSDVAAVPEDGEDVPQLLKGADAMVICTSAVPRISKMSVLKQILKIPLNVVRRKPPLYFRGFRFHYAEGQNPEMVDYEGQKRQVDLAKKLGIKHVVVVSSMGGTDPDNFLNSIGKDKDGNGDGDILLWKRKAEKYLVESGLDYTIIHPGGLLNTPSGENQLVLDVDDKLLNNEMRSISRADVANLCVVALSVAGNGKSASFDCIAVDAKEGEEIKSAEAVLTEFLEKGETTDYSL